MTFQYKTVIESEKYLEIHAAGARSILGILISAFGLVLLIVGVGLATSGNMRVGGYAILSMEQGIDTVVSGQQDNRKAASNN